MARGLGKPRRTASGGVQWRMMINGNNWTSSVYPSASRHNQRLALKEREVFEREQAAKPKPKRPDRPVDSVTENLITLRELAHLKGDHHTAENLTDLLHGDPQKAKAWLDVVNDDTLKDMMGTTKAITTERAKNNSPSVDSLTLEAVCDEYIAKFAHQSRGSRYKKRAAIRQFAEQNGKGGFGWQRSLATLKEQDVIGFYGYLKRSVGNGDIQQSSANTYQTQFMAFIDSTVLDHPEVAPPANLRASNWHIPQGEAEPDPFTVEECRTILEASDEQEKLWFLLMLNICGYQGDLSELQANEVDWTEGRIIRPRSKKTKQAKTAGKKRPAKVNWLLWDETWELLQKYGNRDGTVLLNKVGNVLVTEGRSDSIKRAYDSILKRLKRDGTLSKSFNKTPKSFRKTTIDLAENDEKHEEHINAMLEHSVANKYYRKSGKARPSFDAAITYVGSQLGLTVKRKPIKGKR